MSKLLKLLDYCAASRTYNLEVEAIMSVAAVESNGNGFLPDGRIKILFERHKFARLTNNTYNKEFPQISSPRSGGYYGGVNEYIRFNQAFRLNQSAALQATSWGKFQVMGFNYSLVGCPSPGKLVDYLRESEFNQLDIFLKYCTVAHLMEDLRDLRWSAFGEGYNGADYQRNNYDKKLPSAYNRLKGQGISCDENPEHAANVYIQNPNITAHPALDSLDYSSFVPASESTANPPESSEPSVSFPTTNDEQADDSTFVDSQSPAASSSNNSPVRGEKQKTTTTVLCKERVSVFTRWKTTILTTIGTLTAAGINPQTLVDKLTNRVTEATDNLNNHELYYLIFGLVLIALSMYFYDRAAERSTRLNLQKMDIASDDTKQNVELKAQPSSLLTL